MSKEYKETDIEPTMAAEPTMAYATRQQASRMRLITELSNTEKKSYLRDRLHPSTVNYLLSVDWMENQPFPTYENQDDDSWIDEAEAACVGDIVDRAQIDRDRAAWLLAISTTRNSPHIRRQ